MRTRVCRSVVARGWRRRSQSEPSRRRAPAERRGWRQFRRACAGRTGWSASRRPRRSSPGRRARSPEHDGDVQELLVGIGRWRELALHGDHCRRVGAHVVLGHEKRSAANARARERVAIMVAGAWRGAEAADGSGRLTTAAITAIVHGCAFTARTAAPAARPSPTSSTSTREAPLPRNAPKEAHRNAPSPLASDAARAREQVLARTSQRLIRNQSSTIPTSRLVTSRPHLPSLLDLTEAVQPGGLQREPEDGAAALSGKFTMDPLFPALGRCQPTRRLPPRLHAEVYSPTCRSSRAPRNSAQFGVSHSDARHSSQVHVHRRRGDAGLSTSLDGFDGVQTWTPRYAPRPVRGR